MPCLNRERSWKHGPQGMKTKALEREEVVIIKSIVGDGHAATVVAVVSNGNLRPLRFDKFLACSADCYGLDHDLIGTVEIEFLGEPSITLSL